MPAAEFQFAVPPSERPQSYVLHRPATSICV